MRETDILMIGGSVAGVIAAETARIHYPEASIMVIRKEPESVIPCGIPYLFGTIGSCDKNMMPSSRLEEARVDLLVDEVTEIDREAHTAITAGGEVVRWQKMLMATGSLPIIPPVPGADLPGVFAIYKSTNYLNTLLEAMHRSRKVVFVGGGLIGLELADEFRKQDMEVTVVEMLPRTLDMLFDNELIQLAEEELAKRGIQLRTGNRLSGIQGNGEVESVTLSRGEVIETDLVIFGIGVRPTVDLARKCGLALADDGGVAVDRYLRTSDPDIFAAGDCAAKRHYLTCLPSGIKLASVAAAEARIAGANFFRLQREFDGALGAYSSKIGDLGIGLAGLHEKAAQSIGIDYVVGTARATDKHPRAMPGATPTRVKLLFKRSDGTIIGGQVAGGNTTGEMVNIIAVMIQRGMTAQEIAIMQYSSHPALTASPGMYHFPNAAEEALIAIRTNR